MAFLLLDNQPWVADACRNFSNPFEGIEIIFSLLWSLAASSYAKFSTQKLTEQTTNNSPKKTTNMDEALTNSLPSKRTKHHSDDNVQHPTTTSNNSDTKDDNFNGFDQLLKQQPINSDYIAIQ